jgi:hypothetical protein
MTTGSNETSGRGKRPAPPQAPEAPPAPRLRFRTEIRVGLATSLAAAALQSNKKPPGDEE